MSKNNDITLNISSSTLEIVSFILRDDFLHVRELARLSKVSPTTASVILKGLEEKGILKKKVLGNNYFYSINKNQKAKKLAIMAEEYKTLKTVCSDQHTEYLSEPLMKNIESIKGMIDSVILASSSIIFITSLDHATIQERISKTPNIHNKKIIVMTKEGLKNNLNSDEMKDILKDCLVLHGIEKFIEIIHGFS